MRQQEAMNKFQRLGKKKEEADVQSILVLEYQTQKSYKVRSGI